MKKLNLLFCVLLAAMAAVAMGCNTDFEKLADQVYSVSAELHNQASEICKELGASDALTDSQKLSLKKAMQPVLSASYATIVTGGLALEAYKTGQDQTALITNEDGTTETVTVTAEEATKGKILTVFTSLLGNLGELVAAYNETVTNFGAEDIAVPDTVLDAAEALGITTNSEE